MFNEPFVTIFFRILNFAALFGLFAFIFKKYFYKDVKESIENEHLEEINLNTRINELEHEGFKLAEDIIKQEKFCTYLIERTDQWETAFQKEVTLKKVDQKALHSKSVERTEKQAQTIAKERMVQAIMPSAIENAQKQLLKSFEPPEQGQYFISSILDHMEKSL